MMCIGGFFASNGPPLSGAQDRENQDCGAYACINAKMLNSNAEVKIKLTALLACLCIPRKIGDHKAQILS